MIDAQAFKTSEIVYDYYIKGKDNLRQIDIHMETPQGGTNH